MSIVYLCYEHMGKLKLSGFTAENEVGRKSCEICGANDTVYVINKDEFEQAKREQGRAVVLKRLKGSAELL